jgi:hypothetical protein
MADSKLTAAQERAVFSIRLLQEAQAARERYDAKGELQDVEQVAPCINTLWVTVRAALGYVRPLVTSTQQLPKKFEFGGVTFRLIFPPEGLVQIVEPTTETNLTVGFVGWVDPMKVTALNAAALPPTQPDQS